MDHYHRSDVHLFLSGEVWGLFNLEKMVVSLSYKSCSEECLHVDWPSFVCRRNQDHFRAPPHTRLVEQLMRPSSTFSIFRELQNRYFLLLCTDPWPCASVSVLQLSSGTQKLSSCLPYTSEVFNTPLSSL